MLKVYVNNVNYVNHVNNVYTNFDDKLNYDFAN